MKENECVKCTKWMYGKWSECKVAQWIENGYGDGEIVCSNCGEPCATFSNQKPRDRYCKWCGAKMEGERNADTV